MTKDAPIAFRISAALKGRLVALAKADRRSLSALIEMALEEYAERQERSINKRKRSEKTDA